MYLREEEREKWIEIRLVPFRRAVLHELKCEDVNERAELDVFSGVDFGVHRREKRGERKGFVETE